MEGAEETTVPGPAAVPVGTLSATRDPSGDAGLLRRVSGSVGGCAGRVGEPTGYSPGAPPNQSETDMGHILLLCSDRVTPSASDGRGGET